MAITRLLEQSSRVQIDSLVREQFSGANPGRHRLACCLSQPPGTKKKGNDAKAMNIHPFDAMALQLFREWYNGHVETRRTLIHQTTLAMIYEPSASARVQTKCGEQCLQKDEQTRCGMTRRGTGHARPDV